MSGQRARRIISVALGGAALLGLAEVGFRFAAPSASAQGFHPLRLLTQRGCTKQGALDGEYFVDSCSDEMGFRTGQGKAANGAVEDEIRVLVLGDGNVRGSAVENSDTFSSTFRVALTTATRKPVRLFNAGAIATSQVHQELVMHDVWDVVEPDIVVVAVSEVDDVDENIMWNPEYGVFPVLGASRESFRREERVALLSSRPDQEHSLGLLRYFVAKQIRGSLAQERELLDGSLASWGMESFDVDALSKSAGRRRFLQAYSDARDADWLVTSNTLDRMHRFIAKAGAQMVLLRIPGELSIDDGAWHDARGTFCGRSTGRRVPDCGQLSRNHSSRRLAVFAAKRGVRFVDPGPRLRGATSRQEAIFFGEGGHLTRLGHYRIGQALAVEFDAGLMMLSPKDDPLKPFRGERAVGAYWYPWYLSQASWQVVEDSPELGRYDSVDREVSLQHIHWAQRAEIDFLFVEFSPEHNPDSPAMREATAGLVRLLEERRKRGLGDLKFAILVDLFMGDSAIRSHREWLRMTREHIEQVWNQWVVPFRASYFHWKGKPLLGVFSPPVQIDDKRFEVLRPFWMSPEEWRKSERKDELIPFWDEYPQTVTDARVVSVIPGYNDWRQRREPQLSPLIPRNDGGVYAEQWGRVFEVSPSIVLVYSFNEYLEHTQIEPTKEYGDFYIELTQEYARRWKDGLTLSGYSVDAIRNASLISSDSSELSRRILLENELLKKSGGLVAQSDGTYVLTGPATLSFSPEATTAFLVGIEHSPSLDACVGLEASVVDVGGDRGDTQLLHRFRSRSSQMSILRNTPLSPGGAVFVHLQPQYSQKGDCEGRAMKPIVLRALTELWLGVSKRERLKVDDARVELNGFYEIDWREDGATAWSAAKGEVRVRIQPNAIKDFALEFRDTANYSFVEVGSPGSLQRVKLGPGRLLVVPGSMSADTNGFVTIQFEVEPWRPVDQIEGSRDIRQLGLELEAVLVDSPVAGDSMAPKG